MKQFLEIFKKYGVAPVLGAVTLDSYRRQLLSDETNKKLNEINKLKDRLDSDQKKLFDEHIAMKMKESSTQIKVSNIKETQKEYEDKIKKYADNKSEYNKNELDQSKVKFQEAMENLTKYDLSDLISKMVNKYYEYLSTLTPDKIVALFNIIMSGAILSSFFTVISVMLSEGIINKIKSIERYPKIVKLLKIRSNINKSLNKFHLFMHIMLILFTLLGNMYMFFL